MITYMIKKTKLYYVSELSLSLSKRQQGYTYTFYKYRIKNENVKLLMFFVGNCTFL